MAKLPQAQLQNLQIQLAYNELLHVEQQGQNLVAPDATGSDNPATSMALNHLLLAGYMMVTPDGEKVDAKYDQERARKGFAALRQQNLISQDLEQALVQAGPSLTEHYTPADTKGTQEIVATLKESMGPNINQFRGRIGFSPLALPEQQAAATPPSPPSTPSDAEELSAAQVIAYKRALHAADQRLPEDQRSYNPDLNNGDLDPQTGAILLRQVVLLQRGPEYTGTVDGIYGQNTDRSRQASGDRLLDPAVSQALGNMGPQLAHYRPSPEALAAAIQDVDQAIGSSPDLRQRLQQSQFTAEQRQAFEQQQIDNSGPGVVDPKHPRRRQAPEFNWEKTAQAAKETGQAALDTGAQLAHDYPLTAAVTGVGVGLVGLGVGVKITRGVVKTTARVVTAPFRYFGGGGEHAPSAQQPGVAPGGYGAYGTGSRPPISQEIVQQRNALWGGGRRSAFSEGFDDYNRGAPLAEVSDKSRKGLLAGPWKRARANAYNQGYAAATEHAATTPYRMQPVNPHMGGHPANTPQYRQTYAVGNQTVYVDPHQPAVAASGAQHTQALHGNPADFQAGTQQTGQVSTATGGSAPATQSRRIGFAGSSEGAQAVTRNTTTTTAPQAPAAAPEVQASAAPEASTAASGPGIRSKILPGAGAVLGAYATVQDARRAVHAWQRGDMQEAKDAAISTTLSATSTGVSLSLLTGVGARVAGKVAAPVAIVTTGYDVYRATVAGMEMAEASAQERRVLEERGQKRVVRADAESPLAKYGNLALAMHEVSGNVQDSQLKLAQGQKIKRDSNGRISIAELKKIDLNDQQNIQVFEQAIKNAKTAETKTVADNSSWAPDFMRRRLGWGNQAAEESMDKRDTAAIKTKTYTAALGELRLHHDELALKAGQEILRNNNPLPPTPPTVSVAQAPVAARPPVPPPVALPEAPRSSPPAAHAATTPAQTLPLPKLLTPALKLVSPDILTKHKIDMRGGLLQGVDDPTKLAEMGAAIKEEREKRVAFNKAKVEEAKRNGWSPAVDEKAAKELHTLAEANKELGGYQTSVAQIRAGQPVVVQTPLPPKPVVATAPPPPPPEKPTEGGILNTVRRGYNWLMGGTGVAHANVPPPNKPSPPPSATPPAAATGARPPSVTTPVAPVAPATRTPPAQTKPTEVVSPPPSGATASAQGQGRLSEQETKEIQTILHKKGLLAEEDIDGKFGKKTTEALTRAIVESQSTAAYGAAYQEKYGKNPVIEGIYGEATRRSMQARGGVDAELSAVLDKVSPQQLKNTYHPQQVFQAQAELAKEEGGQKLERLKNVQLAAASTQQQGAGTQEGPTNKPAVIKPPNATVTASNGSWRDETARSVASKGADKPRAIVEITPQDMVAQKGHPSLRQPGPVDKFVQDVLGGIIPTPAFSAQRGPALKNLNTETRTNFVAKQGPGSSKATEPPSVKIDPKASRSIQVASFE